MEMINDQRIMPKREIKTKSENGFKKTDDTSSTIDELNN